MSLLSTVIDESLSLCDVTNALNEFVNRIVDDDAVPIGYPANMNLALKEFYQWYLGSRIFDRVLLNNAANPKLVDNLYKPNTHKHENEIIDFIAPLCGFDKMEHWGFVTSSGTDGNNHGIYFGVKDLFAKTQMRPILYVSADAHFSILRLADLQNLEVRVIPTDHMGVMKIAEYEKVLDPEKPALIVICVGTTFKGAIDDQKAIEEVLKVKKPIASYRHLDAALTGGYSIFFDDHSLINQQTVHFDSISISGHKFFGFDEPVGVFITTKEVLANQKSMHVSYLNDDVSIITCSRSGLAVLKFWWKIKTKGVAQFKEQTTAIQKNVRYLREKLEEFRYPAWNNPDSNIVFIKQPSREVLKKWNMPSSEDAFLGRLSHVVVMQHVTQHVIDQFINDLKMTSL